MGPVSSTAGESRSHDDDLGSTPPTPEAMVRAARDGDTTLLTDLLRRGGDSQFGQMLLHLSVGEGHDEPVIRALVAGGSDVNGEDATRNTPLHIGARGGRARLIVVLVECGARVDVVNNQGSTPLHLAAGFGFPLAIRALVEGGASVDCVDYDGSSPLHVAVRRQQVEGVRTLIEVGANAEQLDEQGRLTPMQAAVQSCQPGVVRVLGEGGAMVRGQKLMHLLIRSVTCPRDRQVETARVLLTLGVDPNEPDETGLLPLSVAEDCRNPEMARVLVEGGADVDRGVTRTPLGCTGP